MIKTNGFKLYLPVIVRVGISGKFSKFHTFMELSLADVTTHGATVESSSNRGTMMSFKEAVCPSMMEMQTAGFLNNIN